MPAISSTPILTSGPDQQLAAVDIYKDNPENVQSISDVQKIDDYLLSVEPGVGNM
jgi:hypothetical protein